MLKRTLSRFYASLRFVTGNDYHLQLIESITNSQHRVVISAMTAAYDELTQPIFDELFVAIKRGVSVTLVFDEFTKSPFAPGIVAYATKGYQLDKLLQVCEKLRGYGASVTFIRPLGINHFKGRYHGKAVIIDDTWYSFGGINFCAEAFRVVDFMIRHTSKKEADTLAALIDAFRDNLVTDDYSTTFAGGTMLVDAGRQKQSIIYSEACRLAEQSVSAVYVSQMQPTGSLVDALQNISTTYYFNRPDQLGFPAKYAAILDKNTSDITNSYKGSMFIHAKCILFRLKDGSRVLISGSHNFHWRGVKYGTQEIAFVSDDTHLWDGLQTFIEQKCS